MKVLRGTPFDPFGYTDERRGERALIGEYEALIDRVLAKLDATNHPVAVQLARVPEAIRGYGPVKARTLAEVQANRERLLEQFEGRAAATVTPIRVA